MDQKMNNNSISSKDDSYTKPEDDTSLSDGTDTVLNKTLKRSHFSFENVRFTPKVIEFVDAFEGKQFAMKINIQNVGRNPVLIKLGEPNSFIFQLKKPSRRAKFLAAGTCLTKTITYTYHNVDLIQKSQIPIQINGHFVDYPIVVKKAVPDIEISPQKLDFDVINLGASAKTLILTILNKGGKRTKFTVDVGKNVLELVVTPMRGTIKPKSEVNVTVEMMGFSEGEYYHEIWIKTNEMPIRVPVRVKVVRPRLEIVYPNGTEDFTLITFNPTFKGTQKAHSFILKNCSSDSTLFNTQAEVDGKLQILEYARRTTDAFSMFKITAEEGRLEPFEKRILTVLFRPKAAVIKKSWHHKQNEKKGTQMEHIVFLRINRVHRIERKASSIDIEDLDSIQTTVMNKTASILQSINNAPTLSSSKVIRNFDYSGEVEEDSSDKRSNFLTESFLPEEKVLRLCLHGSTVDPDIFIQPVSFEFGDVNLGQTREKVLRVTNNTTIPVLCRLCKAVHVKTAPEKIWLKNKEAHEFVVSLTPRSAGKFQNKMKIQILAKSDVVYDSDKALEIVAVYTVTLNYNAQDIFTVPSPKVALGLTPLLTDEAGFQKDLVTFKDSSKLPSAAVLGLKSGFKTDWMKNEKDKLNNVDNALVALPNDRPRLFYTWPKEKICRAIFSGYFRYAPPEDLKYTWSPEERNQRNEQCEYWIDYLTLLKELRKRNYPNPEELNRCLEYDICRKKLYTMGQIISSKTNSSIQNLNILRSCSKKPVAEPEYTFVPLSPSLLSNVIVEPKFINFQKVAANTMAEKTVSINNKNSFPISIKFVSGKSAVSVMEQDTTTIQPLAVKLIKVIFQSHDLGRYFGFLNYIINGSHEFKITISAFVTSKTLILEDRCIEFGNHNPKQAFQPRTVFVPLNNFLQTPVKYRWSISPDSSFRVNITEGVVPPRSRIIAEVLFEMCPKKSFYSEICLISESGTTEPIKLVHSSKKVSVDFLLNRIDLQNIPLNLPTKVKAIVQSACYHDVAFEVMDANPFPGITIEPKQGVIKARSFFPLEIKVQIPVIMKFSFQVTLLVHFVNKISVKISGSTVVPVIRMKPSEVVMRKICAGSIDSFGLCVENIGTTPAEVAVDFKNCPEYKVVSNNYKFHLKPKQASKLMIQFEPSDVARYMFYLPVTVNRILGPPEMQEPETEFVRFYISEFESFYELHGDVVDTKNSNLKIPCICLNSTVTQSLLRISPLNVNFKVDPRDLTKFQTQRLVFSNETTDVVTFCIRNDDLGESNDSPFDLVPILPDSVEHRLKSMKAELLQGEELIMKATFKPKKSGHYSADVPVFVKGYSNGLVYNFIRLRGELKSPRISSEATEIHFSPLPLDVGCDVVIAICAENYLASDTINCIVCDPREENGESMGQYIKTKWLTEPTIPPCKTTSTFQLLINFRSDIPVAIRNYILFFDSMGVYFTIFVTAVADNSAITTHAFLCTRTTKYRLIRDRPPPMWKPDERMSYPVTRPELKLLEKNIKDKKIGSKVAVDNLESNLNSNPCSLQIDRGPRLIIQETKSMSKPTQLGFVNIPKQPLECGTSSSTVLLPTKSKIFNSFISKSESTSGSRTILNAAMLRKNELINDVTYPNFPVQESGYKKHFDDTLNLVERWMFEVVMRCDQYFLIPTSFQNLADYKKPQKPSRKNKVKVVAPVAPETQTPKDFLDFLQEIIGRDNFLPKRLAVDGTISPESKAIKLRAVYAEILHYLENEGCLLPHIRAEYLMEYENYTMYMNEFKNIETFSWNSIELEKMNSLRILQDAISKAKVEKEGTLKKSSSAFSSRDSWAKSLSFDLKEGSESDTDRVDDRNPEAGDLALRNLEPLQDLVVGKHFEHKVETLDKINFEQRSTQAWLDIIIQVFRVFVLKNVVLKSTIPLISVIGMTDKMSILTVELSCNSGRKNVEVEPVDGDDPLISNIFTVHERILMDWLNRHCQIQGIILWNKKLEAESHYQKVINNFDKDLSDSVALISVTASHCPYVVSDYFQDVFLKPVTPNEFYHNAGRCIQAWRALEIGLTVETSDIVEPNPVFMIMLVTHLYEVLPSLHPHSLICFSTPLNSATTRTIQLKNESQTRIFYKAKFFGEFEELFTLSDFPMIELKPMGVTDVLITFNARKIKKVSATLILCGFCVSPDFAKHLAFYLEGEPSELPEHDKYSFSAPLYKVVCTAIPVKPPYTESATYEVWYTTKQPEYSEFVDVDTVIKPWSKIWNRKISRRLFLNKSEVMVVSSAEQETTLGVTIACLTEQNRQFWLLFRSEIGDFIILVEIKPKLLESKTIVTAFYSENWSSSATCLCSDGNIIPKPKNMSSSNCPFLTEVKIPTRNEPLWYALWTMFLKTLQPHEKSFWKEHFEMDIGICLLLWLLSPEEEEDVIDEFVQVLPTRVTYNLKVEAPNDAYVVVPPTIEILDVRQKSEIALPIHISKSAPSAFNFNLQMTSENGKEIRNLQVQLMPSKNPTVTNSSGSSSSTERPFKVTHPL